MIKFLPFLFLLIHFIDCSSSDIKGDEFREKWLRENLYNEKVKQEKAEPDVFENYEVSIKVLVAEKNLEGDEWNQPRRRQKTNLRLYVLKGIHDQEKICEKEQAISLSCITLMRLEGQQVLNFRLVDLDTSYYRTEYGSKYKEDWESRYVREKPLAQIDFTFEGQGKYYKKSGGADFVFTFKKVRH